MEEENVRGVVTMNEEYETRFLCYSHQVSFYPVVQRRYLVGSYFWIWRKYLSTEGSLFRQKGI